MQICAVAAACLLCTASAINEAHQNDLSSASSSDAKPPTMLVDFTDAMSMSEMEKVFDRSQEVQKKSMDAISESMTQGKALEVLDHSSLNTPKLKEITGLLSNRQNLRKALQAHDGFGGLDGARMLLNGMIHEVMIQYDAEIARCTSYYASQCALMTVARGQISAANFRAASARALILDSQANINHCEVSIPQTTLELENHKRQCKKESKRLDTKMKTLLGDIKVMTMILEMSDCDAKFLQYKKLTLLKCKDQCTGKTQVSFNHNGLQEQVKKLQLPAAQALLKDNFADMFDDDDSQDETELLQVEGSEYMEVRQAPNKTEYNNPPVPRTQVPSNPCTDKYGGAPPPRNKRAGKCTLTKTRCYELQGRFLQIQAEIADARDELLVQIAELQSSCDETKKTLESSINNDGNLLSSSQTKLSTAMEKEASAGETSRQVASENHQYNDDLMKQMKICTNNYRDFENELCALKKIRGDLFRKMKPGHNGLFQDCEVSTWTPESCTRKCAGGEQKLIRSVMSHAAGGAKCLPLSAERRCNLSPCPVNCALEQWGGWSKCSAKCSGGVATRVRDVKTAMQHGGKPCGSTQEAKACNIAACEKDCVLHRWTRWTACSKHCDGGSRKRERMVLKPAEGSGSCADKWDPSRLQYQACAKHRCQVPNPNIAMKCDQSMDIVLVLDGTPRGGKDTFKHEIEGAKKLVDAFEDKGIVTNTSFALYHYTGPRTWSGVSKCTGMSTKKVNMEEVCKITLVQHFTDDMKEVKSRLDGLTFQPGSKLLSLALMSVQSEFALGNKNHRTIVVVWVDGQPLSYRKTLLASRAIRKKARLLWVTVSKYSPLKSIKEWASRRWQENLVIVEEGAEFQEGATATHIVANICPRKFPELRSASTAGGDSELPLLDLIQKDSAALLD